MIVFLVEPQRNPKLPVLDSGDDQYFYPLLEAARRRRIKVDYITGRGVIPENAELYVSVHPHYAYGWKKRVDRTVVLYHGLGDGELGGFYCSTRPLFLNRISIPTRLWRGWLVPGEKFANGYPKYLRDHVKVVGFPKLDLFFSEKKKEMMEVVREQCALKLPFPNTVIYAPTFWPSYSLQVIQDSVEIGRRLIEASQSDDFNLILKAHTNIGRNGYGLGLLKLMEKYQKKSGINCLIPPGKMIRSKGWVDNIVPLFWFADVLVSDYSSTLREFMVTDKPSVQVLSPFYKPLPGMYHTELNQLTETLSRAFDRIADPHEERLLQVKHYMFKADGHSSDRAISALLELCEAGIIHKLFHRLTSKMIEYSRHIFAS